MTIALTILLILLGVGVAVWYIKNQGADLSYQKFETLPFVK